MMHANHGPRRPAPLLEAAVFQAAWTDVMHIGLAWLGLIVAGWVILKVAASWLPDDRGGLSEFKERDRKAKQRRIKIEAEPRCTCGAPATTKRPKDNAPGGISVALCFACSVQWDLNRGANDRP